MLIKDFYKINTIKNQDNVINANITINNKHKIFEGHFPEQSIVPGVMQKLIIKEITESTTSKKLQTKKISNMKFLSVINPDVNNNLEIEIKLKTDENDKILKIDAKIYKNETIYFKIKAQYLYKHN